MSDVPLPLMPEPPPPFRGRARVGVTANRVNPRHRVLCGDCTRLIHELGMALAPYPRAAKWRVVADSDVTFCCDIHKHLRMEGPQ